MPDFDYCLTGAGCAGLSLLMRMLSEPALQKKKILLVDRDPKTANDRTWCFWEKGEGFFEPVVYRRWERLWFHDEGQARLLDTHPYVYKMIRGADFYNYCFETIRRFRNVVFLPGNVDSVRSDADSGSMLVDGRKVTAGRIFNSIPFDRRQGRRDWRLLQHFKGWVIRSLRPAFQPGEATLMDFRVSQEHGTAFFYVMPFSSTEALVECTFFTGSVLPESAYTGLLTGYISAVLKIRDYVIVEKEMGVIPMTSAVLPRATHRMRNIGAAAGLTKPSTGYTFQFIQRDSAEIVHSLTGSGEPAGRSVRGRFQLYDRILLNVLITRKLSGQRLFSTLFTRTELPDLLAFLDNDSTPLQDWSIIRSLPKGPFVRAALGELFSLSSGPRRVLNLLCSTNILL
jgi:lycopene beta-cyclase